MTASRLVVVSNRLPITIEENGKEIMLRPSTGGVVSALLPILRETGGAWVGWTGTFYDDYASALLQGSCSTENYSFEPVFLSAAERASYYQGFSNEIIWPLFHGLPSRCQFDSTYWRGYSEVNEKFADAVECASDRNSFIWIHDYHLMVLARSLRLRGMKQRLGYFHHIPFPAPDIFETLPWRNEILHALLHFNKIGLQTERDRNNFIGCVERLVNNVHISQLDDDVVIRFRGESTAVGVYPISIDYGQYADRGAQQVVTAAADTIANGLHARVVLGVDRLDYTKGIPERLCAFQKFLESTPDMRGRVTMVQIVVPSREEISEYKQLKLRIETMVSKINGEYGRPGWIPIHYFYRSVSETELSSFYRAADIALVTPLKDGMNLVAKEFCASRVDNQGVLILSEFAGAAEELKCGAVIVNPHDTDAVASSIDKGLQMGRSEQRIRMEKMRALIRANDVFEWSRSFTSQYKAADCVSA